MKLTAVFRKVPQGYIAFVEELPDASARGETLNEARARLVENIQLLVEANRVLAQQTYDGPDVIREPFELSA